MTLQELERIRTIRDDMEQNDEAIERLQSQMERVTQMITDMPKGGAERDLLALQVQRLHTLQVQREIMHIDLEIELIAAETWIAKLPEQQRKVMYAYYICGVDDWKRVARHVNYSYKHTLRIRDAAYDRLVEYVQQCPL